MKQILIELDDRCAQDLARVAPAGKGIRAEFIRLAVRRAVDLALDRDTEARYRAHPLPKGVAAADLVGWDPENRLAKPARAPKKLQPARSAKKRVA